jgi:hypothetical protein
MISVVLGVKNRSVTPIIIGGFASFLPGYQCVVLGRKLIGSEGLRESDLFCGLRILQLGHNAFCMSPVLVPDV